MVRIAHNTRRFVWHLSLAEVQLFDSLGTQLPNTTLAFKLSSTYNYDNDAAVGAGRSASSNAPSTPRGASGRHWGCPHAGLGC